MNEVAPSTTKGPGLVSTMLRFGQPQLLEFATTATLGFAVSVLSARTLGVSGRGVLALLLQWAYLLQVVFVAGSDRAVLGGIGDARSTVLSRRHTRFVTRVSIAAMAGSVTLLVIGALSRQLLVFSAGLVLVVATEEAIRQAIQVSALVLERPWWSVQHVLPAQVVSIVLVLICASADVRQPRVWLLCYLVPNGISMLIWLIGRQHRAAGTMDGGLRAFGVSSLAFLPGSLALMVALRGDRLLLGLLGNTAEVGLYVTAATAMELTTTPALMLADIAQSRWAALARRDREGVPVREIALIPFAALVVAALSSAAARWLIVPLFGEAFAGGRRLALPLGLAGGFLAARTLLAALGVVLGQKAWVVRSEAAMAGLALIGYLALIPDHGAMGAAWASVIAYAGAAMLLILVAVRNWQGATPVQRTALPAVLQADLGTNTAAAADDER